MSEIASMPPVAEEVLTIRTASEIEGERLARKRTAAAARVVCDPCGFKCEHEFCGAGKTPSPWLPISTALKDGTLIDLWRPDYGRLTDCAWVAVEPVIGEPWGWMNMMFGRISDATHWMPIPAPPTE